MSHVAIIAGISGQERYLDRERAETAELRRARHFRSRAAAEAAARAHISAFPQVVQRHMEFRVEELPS